ncbi:MAG: 4-alpha-glucanotransferase [Actinomycetaceae bacterium]|nr:4-alpha-glucanotransferase [Actinomycetaceae bacterium]
MTPPIHPEIFSRIQLLAQKSAIATTYWDWHGNLREVQPRTLIKVLNSLGIDLPQDPQVSDLDKALTAQEDQIWLRTVPACTVMRVGTWRDVHIHVPDGSSVRVEVTLEDGTTRSLTQVENWDPAREVNGSLIGRAAFALDESLPLGDHTITAYLEDGTSSNGHLVVVPHRIDPPSLNQREQMWGIASQLYSVRSAQSWGMGDTAVLASLNQMFGRAGADFHLINPMHAVAPCEPIEPSPYLPVTRQFLAPLYISPEMVEEYQLLKQADRIHLQECHALSLQEETDNPGLIDRDQSWMAKNEALSVLFRQPRSQEREAEFNEFIETGGQSLERFAQWCALVETYSMPLPPQYRDSESEAVKQFSQRNELRVRYHMWLQWIASQQLQEAQKRAREAGMAIGIMGDLAVGVHPYGSEVWDQTDMFAPGMCVGAPPDMYSQQGQNWSQPPWNPQALAESGYSPLRAMIRATMSYAGAVRIDHILGLFRLWWIPDGMGANHGAYVHYDHEAMVGILLLEAQRAGCVVIGEDLGTVEPWVRGYLNERGILGTSILWFERNEDGSPLAPQHYRREVLAAVNTHDLPPTAGYMRGIHTKLRSDLGLLVESYEKMRQVDRAELENMSQALRAHGALHSAEPSEEELIEALYRYIAKTPARLLAVSLVDIVGDIRPQNLPGTHTEYPNWKMPLGNSSGREVTFEEIPPPGIKAHADIMNATVGK